MPDKVTTKSRCSTTGEEALLVFLKRMTYPARGNDLIGFFRRCEGWISEVVQACLEHLLPIAEKLVKNFDHVRVSHCVCVRACVCVFGLKIAYLFPGARVRSVTLLRP